MDFTRSDVRFRSHEADCAAWLYRPDRGEAGGAMPLVVLAHGLGAVKEMGLDAYAEGFARAGYAALVFDYRYFGGSGGTPRQLLDIGRQLEDWACAIDYARRLDGVDATRISLFGTSFSGGHVIVTASRDPNVACVIAQCPFTDGPASALKLGPLPSIRVALLAIRDLVGKALGRPPIMVELAGRPGDTALMNRPDVMSGYQTLVPSGTHVPSTVAARVGLAIPFHVPGLAIGGVSCPIMFSVCDRDSVAPAWATRRHARRARRGEVVAYPFGHFEIYKGAAFERAFADQLDFLRRHVPLTSS